MTMPYPSSSYPYLALSRYLDLDYGLVLDFADWLQITNDEPERDMPERCTRAMELLRPDAKRDILMVFLRGRRRP